MIRKRLTVKLAKDLFCMQLNNYSQSYKEDCETELVPELRKSNAISKVKKQCNECGEIGAKDRQDCTIFYCPFYPLRNGLPVKKEDMELFNKYFILDVKSHTIKRLVIKRFENIEFIPPVNRKLSEERKAESAMYLKRAREKKNK